MARTTQITLKLLVDKSARKVVFAEASKEVVDFLIEVLQIPVCSIVKLLTTERMVGAIGNFYKSMEDLDDSYLLPKNTNCYGSYKIDVKVNYVEGTEVGGASNGGYVKGVVTYIIMDNLSITPMSTISSIALLNKCNVREVGALEEKIVKLGFDEAREILKASMESKTVLTDVFLAKKKYQVLGKRHY
ncbi:hypothetical protein Cni_G15646 [Canna indica]|uniref:DUF674 domain-containing protein n=1 Tax=Canna indica TaxID=4628 RepID=A0AAQ3KJW4_9LILI|nr:hypothetical protein Cni_G15646 [Canna indica]